MTDPREQILTELAAAVGAETGYTVELDRQKPVNERELPLVVVRSGSEETATVDGSKGPLWSMRWTMRPSVEVYLFDTNEAALKSSVSQAYMNVLRAVQNSALINRFQVKEVPISAEMTPVFPAENARFAGVVVDFSFTYDRNIS